MTNTLWVITLKGKPATYAQLDKATGNYGTVETRLEKTVIAAATKQSAIDLFIYCYGFTFPEWRKDGIDVSCLKAGAL